jgi:hypothetical protein
LKQVAQQDAEKQRFLVEKVSRNRIISYCSFNLKQKAEQSRQANVIAAEGDARAADLIGKALGEAGDGKFESLSHSFMDLFSSFRFNRTSTNRSS